MKAAALVVFVLIALARARLNAVVYGQPVAEIAGWPGWPRWPG